MNSDVLHTKCINSEDTPLLFQVLNRLFNIHRVYLEEPITDQCPYPLLIIESEGWEMESRGNKASIRESVNYTHRKVIELLSEAEMDYVSFFYHIFRRVQLPPGNYYWDAATLPPLSSKSANAYYQSLVKSSHYRRFIRSNDLEPEQVHFSVLLSSLCRSGMLALLMPLENKSWFMKTTNNDFLDAAVWVEQVIDMLLKFEPRSAFKFR